jgi:ATP phosphoribosyltransferase
MSRLKIALQKSGRLSQDSLQLLKACGIKLPNNGGKLMSSATNFPLDILFLRDDDIPEYVEQQVADIGIIGENIWKESNKPINIISKLGFSSCRLSLAIPNQTTYNGLQFFANKRIATSYPTLLSSYFKQHDIPVHIEILSGSVEIATSIGLADAICDIVSTGSTLLSNGLKEVETIFYSEAVLVSNSSLPVEKQELLERLLFRINAVKQAKENKYILLNAPNSAIDAIVNLLPGMNSPTILPLAKSGWSSLHSVIGEDKFWEVIDQLKQAGAEGILVVPIEKMIR